jgi:hypothetical protein
MLGNREYSPEIVPTVVSVYKTNHSKGVKRKVWNITKLKDKAGFSDKGLYNC